MHVLHKDAVDDMQVTMIDRGRTMIPSTILLLKLLVCYSNSVSMTVISSLVLVNTHTCVIIKERISDMMSAGPFVAGLKCSGIFLGIQCQALT